MANLIFDKVQIEATIDKIVDRTMRMDMTWDWPCGVAYYGICEAYEVTKNERYLQLVKDRVDEYIELGLPRWTVNTCSMGHCLITLYQHTGDEKYLNIAKSKVEYLEKEALRFGDHVLQHTVSVNNDFPEQAWADTLFMAGRHQVGPRQCLGRVYHVSGGHSPAAVLPVPQVFGCCRQPE